MVIKVFEQILRNGISAQLEGHLEEADRLYQKVLEKDPKNADAWQDDEGRRQLLPFSIGDRGGRVPNYG